MKEGLPADFSQDIGIWLMPVKIHGVYDGLTDTDSLCLDLDIGRKTLAQISVGKIGNCKRIIDDAADQVLPFPVKIHVKFRDGFHKIPDSRIEPFHIGQQIRGEDNAASHIQAHHVDQSAAAVHFPVNYRSRIRIAPVIVLGNRRAVAVALKGSAHRDQLVDPVEGVRIPFRQQGQVGHGPEGDDPRLFPFQRFR